MRAIVYNDGIGVYTLDMTADNTDSWKKKYFTNLENLEGKERALSDLEGVLRLALSRLTLAAEGVDDGLDRQLAELRKTARGSFDKPRLERMIEAISETMKRLDSKHARRVNPERRPPKNPLPDPLIAVLDAIDLPKAMGKRAKEARKQLAEAMANEQSKQCITLLACLINESLVCASNKTLSEDSDRITALHVPAPKPAAKIDIAGRDADLPLSKELLASLLRGMSQRSADTGVLARIHQELQGATHERELRTLTQDMVTLLTSTNTQSHAIKQQEVGNVVHPIPSFATHEILIQLLDSINFAAELAEQTDNIKERLLTGIKQDQWPALLKDIVELIAAMRTRVEAEKSELESFLFQLTERLQELDQHLRGAETMHTDTQTRSSALDAAVHAQMDGIETSIHGATSLTELKASIQERLDHIKVHFQEHRQTEEEQQAALQLQLKKATSRLNALESEADRLKIHLQAQQLQATMDTLTNLPNRLAYDARLEREYARWKRYKTSLTLLVLDVDRFKQINDTYGHKAGDKALKLIAFVLKQAVRETDFVARYGGEEFVAIITDTPSIDVKKVAEKMRVSVEAADFHHNKQKVAITISIGISSFEASDTAEMVFLRADKALYRAKSQGRNYCVYDNSFSSNEKQV